MVEVKSKIKNGGSNIRMDGGQGSLDKASPIDPCINLNSLHNLFLIMKTKIIQTIILLSTTNRVCPLPRKSTKLHTRMRTRTHTRTHTHI